MKYIVIKIEYCNGIPFHDFEIVSDAETAKSIFNDLCNKAQSEYPVCVASKVKCDVEYLDSFMISDSNPTGNGYIYAIIAEDKVMDAIISIVDNSEDTITVEHRGDIDYDMSCKCFFFDSLERWKANKGDFPENFCSYVLNKIVKRPYDMDCPMDEDSIYDVYLSVLIDNGGLDIQEYQYCESLEVININTLLAIFCEIFFQ